MTTQQAVRRWIMTAAVAGVTMTGTIYGATLKSEQDVKKVHPSLLSYSFPSLLSCKSLPISIGLSRNEC